MNTQPVIVCCGRAVPLAEGRRKDGRTAWKGRCPLCQKVYYRIQHPKPRPPAPVPA